MKVDSIRSADFAAPVRQGRPHKRPGFHVPVENHAALMKKLGPAE